MKIHWNWCIVTVSLLMFALSAQAANRDWNGSLSTNFSDAANWSALPVSGDVWRFGATSTSGTVLNNDLASGLTVSNITYIANMLSYTLNGNAIKLFGTVALNATGPQAQTINLDAELGGDGTNVTFTTRSGADITLGGNLSGAGGLIKSGAGTLVINGNNTFSGPVSMTAGTVKTGSGTAFGAGTVTFNGGGWESAGTGNHVIANNIVLQGANTAGNSLSASTDFTGNFSGTGNLSINGFSAGTVKLSGDNSAWSGNWGFTGQNKLQLNHVKAIGSGTTITFRTPNAADTGRGVLESLVALTGANAITQNVSLGNASGFANNPATIRTTADMEITGVVSGASDAIFIKDGASTLTFNGANTYAGDTTVSAGTLVIDGDSSGATGTITVSLDAVLGGNGTVGGNIVLADGAKWLFDAASTLTANGASVDLGNLGVAGLVGLDNTVAEGVYTLIDGTAAFDFTSVQNLGAVNAYDLGGGKSAYFQQGSLDLVVVPEPATVGMLGLGALITMMIRRLRL